MKMGLKPMLLAHVGPHARVVYKAQNRLAQKSHKPVWLACMAHTAQFSSARVSHTASFIDNTPVSDHTGGHTPVWHRQSHFSTFRRFSFSVMWLHTWFRFL
ncbi:hypothetical protein J1N35_028670 [Gossypium stocksii]|uniref:Uncharacterized protein n=1 Tax=Gossypium stocksii TaxID=47602 RepID=A0A9D3ZSB9_9ROSI|nr:hypothetical protein J1N35_028670 [Gossypium stocksii]